MKKSKKIVFFTRITAIIICLTFLIAVFFKDNNTNTAMAENTYKEKLIRFHVIANSDSEYDQALKLKVRDSVLKKIGSKIENVTDIEESRNIIRENIDYIQEIADAVILENTRDYKSKVYLQKCHFPTKKYGNIVLPAGEYEAVRIVLGNGKGKNWWCVMFPPLCYIDVSNGLTDKRSEAELKSILTQEEYNMIVKSENYVQSEVKLKSKVVEILEETKIKLANVLVGARAKK
ncbi:stage II sporulation protein R [Abyssisolibacter fermentans]|uniref:stage II sporulation protein R n=1 Tax=Abyssisolibacter fermentans TaxID=1766203 RepID=UPI00082B96A5|nr:stage II sporulation protein R [Abyssisolibacter fermentans]